MGNIQHDVPLMTIAKYSALATFEDMVVGESRYFIKDHLQLFRVFASRLNNNPDRKAHCVIMQDGDSICVSKVKPTFIIGEQDDSI